MITFQIQTVPHDHSKLDQHRVLAGSLARRTINADGGRLSASRPFLRFRSLARLGGNSAQLETSHRLWCLGDDRLPCPARATLLAGCPDITCRDGRCRTDSSYLRRRALPTARHAAKYRRGEHRSASGLGFPKRPSGQTRHSFAAKRTLRRAARSKIGRCHRRGFCSIERPKRRTRRGAPRNAHWGKLPQFVTNLY